MEYLTPQDIEKGIQNGIPEHIIKYRFYTRGWSKRRSITQEYIKKQGLWKQYKETCEQTGISHVTFYERMKKYGWTPEQAATTPVTDRAERSRIRNGKPAKLTKDMIEQAVQNGINEHALKIRVYQYHWPIERAMTEPIHREKRKRTV